MRQPVPAVLWGAVLCLEEMEFHILKVLACLWDLLPVMPVYTCCQSGDIKAIPDAAYHDRGRGGSSVYPDRDADHPGNVCGKIWGIHISDRTGGTGGRQADHRFSAAQA